MYAVLEQMKGSSLSQETLEVASQCIAGAYGLNLDDAAEKEELSIKPRTLLEVSSFIKQEALLFTLSQIRRVLNADERGVSVLSFFGMISPQGFRSWVGEPGRI